MIHGSQIFGDLDGIVGVEEQLSVLGLRQGSYELQIITYVPLGVLE